jgi:hypothetical protein
LEKVVCPLSCLSGKVIPYYIFDKDIGSIDEVESFQFAATGHSCRKKTKVEMALTDAEALFAVLWER